MKKDGYFRKSVNVVLIVCLISSTIPTASHAAAQETYGLTPEQLEIVNEAYHRLKTTGESYRDFQVQLFRNMLNTIKDKRALIQARSDVDAEALKYGFKWKINEVPKPGTIDWRVATDNGESPVYQFVKQYCDPSAMGNVRRVFAFHKHAATTGLWSAWSTFYNAFSWDIRELLKNLKNRYQNYTFSDFATAVFTSPATEIALSECYEGLPETEAKLRRLNFVLGMMSYDVIGTVMGLGLSVASWVLLWKVALPKATMAAKVKLLKTPVVGRLIPHIAPYVTKKNAMIGLAGLGAGYLIYSYYYYTFESKGLEKIETDQEELIDKAVTAHITEERSKEMKERITFLNSALENSDDFTEDEINAFKVELDRCKQELAKLLR